MTYTVCPSRKDACRIKPVSTKPSLTTGIALLVYVKMPKPPLPMVTWDMLMRFAKEYTGANPGLVKTEPTMNNCVSTDSFPINLCVLPCSSDYIIILSDAECFGVTDSYSLSG